MNKHLVVSEELNTNFRDAIANKKKLKKGIIKNCTEEAIKEWILKNRGNTVGYV